MVSVLSVAQFKVSLDEAWPMLFSNLTLVRFLSVTRVLLQNAVRYTAFLLILCPSLFVIHY